MKLLITGASGFLGRKIVNRCVESAIPVHALGRTSLDGDLDFHVVDIRNKQTVLEVVQSIKPTHILHLASAGVTRDNSSLADMLLANTVGTDNLLEAAAALAVPPVVVLMGSAYEYESSDMPLAENAFINPKSPYVISKTASAYCMARYADVLPMLYLRLFNVYGPGEPDARLIPYIVDCARKGRPIQLTGCKQLRDFMFVDDLVDIILQLLLKHDGQPGSEILNVGTGTATSLEYLVRETGESLLKAGIETTIEFGALPYRRDDPMCCYADITKLLRKIGNYQFTSIADGVGKTVENLL